MSDSSIKADAVARAAINKIDPVERLRLALVHSEQMRDVALAQLRTRYPGRSTLELVELLLGKQLIPRKRAPESG